MINKIYKIFLFYILKIPLMKKIIIKISNVITFDKKQRRLNRKYLSEYCERMEVINLEKKYSDYWIFPLFSPWGDLAIACSLIKSFKHKNGGKILVLVSDKNRAKVAKSFKSIDKVIIQNKKILGYINTNPHTKIKKGFYYEINHWLFVDAPNYKSKNFLELYSNMLGLSDGTIIERPTFSEEVKVSVQHYIQKKHIKPEHTIILAPQANSFKSKNISMDFWINLANQLEKEGYDIIFNSSKKIKNYKTIFLPMIETLYLSEICKGVIGLRAGYNDILGIMQIKNLFAIYPQSMFFNTISKFVQLLEFKRSFLDEKDKSFDENMYRITSLKMFGDATAKEYIYSNNDVKIINNIIQNLKSSK